MSNGRTERGHFTTKFEDGQILFNEYDCTDCKAAGIEHSISHVPDGHTDRYSTWGAGIPTTRRVCSACKRWDGPWVSTDYVGGGY